MENTALAFSFQSRGRTWRGVDLRDFTVPSTLDGLAHRASRRSVMVVFARIGVGDDRETYDGASDFSGLGVNETQTCLFGKTEKSSIIARVVICRSRTVGGSLRANRISGVQGKVENAAQSDL